MLASIRRRCPSITSSCFQQLELARGYLTHRRQQQEEWWAVDGEIFQAEEFDSKRVLEPSPNMQVSNKKRRKDRLKDLTLSRLKFRSEDQESYWASYIRRYQIMRDEWEKLVWDPKPVPQPKTRNPTYVKQDAEKYVWRDPRRDAYYADRMTMPFTPSNFNKKTASRFQGTDQYPYEAQRDTGAQSNRSGGSYQPNVNRGLYQDVRRSQIPYYPHRNMGAHDNDKFGGSYKPYGGSGGDHEAEHRLRGGYYSQRDREVPQNERSAPYISRIQYEDNDKRSAGRVIKQANGNYKNEEKYGDAKYQHRKRGWSEDDDEEEADVPANRNRGVRSQHRSNGSSEDDDDDEVANMNYKNKVKYGDTLNMAWLEDEGEDEDDEDDDDDHPGQANRR